MGFAIDALQATEHVPAAGGTLRRVAGRVYEDYVFRSLDLVSGSGTVRRGNDVLSVDELNCDFVCEEPTGVTLVEAKSVRLRLRVEMTKERDLLKAEMKEKGLGHGLAQLDASSVRLRNGDAGLDASVPTFGLLVVRGELVFVNSDLFRSILEELAEEELGHTVTVRYQVTNDEGFDLLIRRLAAGHSLFDFLSSKESDPRSRRDDMHHAVVSQTGGLAEHPLRQEQIAARTELYDRYLVRPIPGLV